MKNLDKLIWAEDWLYKGSYTKYLTKEFWLLGGNFIDSKFNKDGGEDIRCFVFHTLFWRMWPKIQCSWHHIIYVFINPPVHGVTDHCLKNKVYFPCVHILLNYSIHKVCKSQLSSWINFRTMHLHVNRTSEIPIMFTSHLIPLIVVHYFDF